MKKKIALELTQEKIDIIMESLSQYYNIIDDDYEKDVIDEIMSYLDLND